METDNFISKKIDKFILFIFLLYFNFVDSYDTSLLKINFFVNNNNLYYVNAINNDKGNVYIEYWGKNNILYLMGINGETGEELYLGDSKVKTININSNSIYHDSIIIEYDNNEYILSINYKTFDFININTGNFYYKTTKDILFEDQGEPTFKNSIIKLKNNKYLFSMIIYEYGTFYNSHELVIETFNFSPNNNINKTKQYKDTIDFTNSTNCFQTESQYIQCSYNRYYGSQDYFTIGIFDYQELEEKEYYDLDPIKDFAFTKIFHLKNEIGIYINFNKDTNLPKIHIKELDTNKLELNYLFDPIILNANGKYTLNNGLFYSDGIKINDSKFVVILTSENLLNLLICMFDLYNNDKSLRLRYFYLPLNQINIKISVNIRAFKVGNFLGLTLYNSKSNYPGYALFNFPNFINNNNYCNNTSKEIEIFIDSSSYSFSLQDNILITNNIFGGNIEKIKIINYEDKLNSGVIIKSQNLNSEISINDELSFNDILIFEPNLSGAIPGEYILEFSLILKDLNYNDGDSLAEDIAYYGVTTNYQPNTFTGNTFKLIYQVKCYEKCKTCTRLGSESFYFCAECIDHLPLNINEGEKCVCDKYIYIDENLNQYCIENCENFKYNIHEYEKYCLSSCLFNNEELYLDEEYKECYKSCSDNKNGNIYPYFKKCVGQYPQNYSSISNNTNNLPYTSEIVHESVTSSTIPEFLENRTELVSITDAKDSEDITQITNNIFSNSSSNFYIIIDESIKPSDIIIIDKTNEIPETILIEKESITAIVKANDIKETNTIEYNDFLSTDDIHSNPIPSLIDDFIENNIELETKQINNDTIIYCYSSETNLDTLISLNPDLTYLNFKECIDILTKEKIIQEKSDLLIIIKKYFNITSKNNFDYEMYTRDGTNITNLSICDKTNIEISTPIKDLDAFNYYEAEYFSKQGYDIYNKSSEFYYDYCLSTYVNQSDLTVSLRQQEIYPKNVSLCKDGCIYNDIDYDTKRINCICNTNVTEENEFIEEVESNFFTYILDMINYKIFSCYDKFLDANNFSYNFGFYIGSFLTFSLIFFSFLFLCLGKKSIRRQYFLKEPKLNEIKEIELQFQFQNLKINNIPKNCFGSKSANKNSLPIQFSPTRKKIKNKAKKRSIKKKKKKKTTINSSKNIHSKFTSGNLGLIKSYLSSTCKNLTSIPISNESLGKVTQKNSENIEKIEKIDYSEMYYEEALEKDQRNIFQIFLSLFVLKLQSIQIIFYPKEFTHLSLTLSLYSFEYLLDLTVNSLLFSDDIISQKYYNNGELLLFTTNLLSISSNIISFFILYLLEKLINQYEVLDVVTKEIKDSDNFLKVFNKLTRCFDLKIKIFYFILTIIAFLCTYYLFIFFSIYKKIQKDLFINYIVGSLWSLGFTVSICLFITITRKISINKKIKRMFIISKFIDDIF